MALALFALGVLVVWGVPVWGVPLAAGALVWGVYASPSIGALIVAGVSIGVAAPLSVGLAGSILDRVCRVGGLSTAAGAGSFRLLGLVLLGAVALRSDAPLELLATVQALSVRGTGLDLLGIVTRVGGAICLCGGLLALVGLGAIVLVELPLRWVTSSYRVSPLDLSLGAVRPLVLVGVATALFHLGSALVAHETAPQLLGGVP